MIKLIVVFGVIIGGVLLKRGLGESIIVAAVATIILFQIPLDEAARLVIHSIYEKETLLMVGNFILVTFIQRIMENKKLLERAELALARISGNRRLVCMVTPIVIGFLPSAGAVNICGKIVNDTVGDDLDVQERLFVTSYYRHISESFSPTYNAILLALTITGVSTGSFVLCMVPMVVVLLALGYLFYLKKIDKNYSSIEEEYNKVEEWKQLIFCFWPLFLCIIIVIIFNFSVIQVMPLVILLAILIYRLSVGEVIAYAKTSIEKRIIVNTVVLMMFKNLLTYTGVIETLPSVFESASVPAFVAYGLIMFFGTVVSGANAMIVLLIPLAFSTIPGAGTALVVFLMSISYIAMQVSPTHICLTIVTEYFQESWGNLVKKTLPIVAIFLVILHVYYMFLIQLGL